MFWHVGALEVAVPSFLANAIHRTLRQKFPERLYVEVEADGRCVRGGFKAPLSPREFFRFSAKHV